MVKWEEYEALLVQAAASPFGTSVAVVSGRTSQVRRRLYAVRERLRKDENHSYDSLSFLVRGNSVWILRRESVPLHDDLEIQIGQVEPLKAEELPNRVYARGPHRSGFLRVSCDCHSEQTAEPGRNGPNLD